jgi:hypothetical protein
MLEVCSVSAHPIANAIRAALSVSKTGVVALNTGSLISIPGLSLTPHELMGYLVNLSFEPVTSPKAVSVSLTASDKTLQDIVNRIGMKLASTENVDLNAPILVVTEGVILHLLIATHTFDAPLGKETVNDYAIHNGMNLDTTITSSLPMFQERDFPFEVIDLGGNRSRISFKTVPLSAVQLVLNTLQNLPKM